MQLYCYFVSQCSEFCRHNPLCCFSTSNTKGKRMFHYRLSPETFGYTFLNCQKFSSRIFVSFTLFLVTWSTSATLRPTSARAPLVYRSISRNLASVCIALGYGLDDRGFESRQGLGIFLFTTASRTALGPTQPPIQWVPGAVSLGVKQPVREGDHSLPSSDEVKECVELYLHSPNTSSWRGA
jgi:hypothetical protein